MKLKILLISFYFLLACGIVHASIEQAPEWYRLSTSLSAAPEINKKVVVLVKLSAIVGDLENSAIKVIAPDKWLVDKSNVKVGLIQEGTSKIVKFGVTPKTFVTRGSIITQIQLRVPKKAIIKNVESNSLKNKDNIINSINHWPPVTKRYANVNFALDPEESLYPLSDGLWLAYSDYFKIKDSPKGVVYYDSSIITDLQAKTDIEMYDRLRSYIKKDKDLTKKLIDLGISIKKKKYDQLLGLYVLSVRAFANENFEIAGKFINRFYDEIPNDKNMKLETLKIAAGNLKALIYWAKGQKRLALSSFKKVFYSNKKNPLQRYVLRNLGLLMWVEGNKKAAVETFRLAKKFSSSYTLLNKEYAIIKK